ncbi:SWI/SNF-related matrix-associated actin-dependent regulator of chromatin subfamily E member 1 isoform X1 [Rhagoletis pomonella]|uniref:SWI/SNF-related matrix-associated actin-dependent regulator of chromatin subfamily E member 1 isoform X1 n=1 Tax=Rhagoletis pomonella TaxID=28610 RepID=UPI00177E3337|nr:SWI/SNF-related matrix-associated actin-dependent regulator of chromatin subfamily E member 1 isoform X1 [Rhagoletis pomonella]
MSLPSNYKQIAVGASTGPSTPAPSSGSGSSRSRSSGAGGGSDRNKDTTPIFTHSNYGNPAFTPQKAGKSASSKTQAESRTPKPPKPPEKPVLPYMRYSKRIWDSVKAQYPDLKLWELGKKIGAMWKQLTESEKQEFIDEYETDKAEYEKALKTYHNSPAYLSFLAAKSKVKTDSDVHDTPSRSSGKSQQERRIDIQPAEDEDDQDEGYSFKHVAYARYLRNHRLINEIFSDAVVPDVRSVVTTQRMQVLKRQVSSLTMHQTKLEAELQQMEEKFEAKKQRMVESSEAFQEELKRHCKPAVDEDTFQKMVVRMYEEMKKERQRADDHPLGSATSITGAASPQTLSTRSDEKPTAQAGQSSNPMSGVASSTGKKDAPTPSSQIISTQKETVESGSKTDPEPMDIENPPKPSVPLPPRPEAPKIAPKTGNEPMKEVTNKPQIPSIIKPGQHGKVPTPTPTPPPPTISLEHSVPNQQQSAPTGVPNLPSQVSIPPAQTPPPQSAAQQNQQPPQPQTGQQPPPQQQQVPPTMSMHPHHPPPPSHTHLPPHLPPHQPMSAIPPHSNYGSYGAPTGPTRSPYYQPQYGAHPSQPYSQYAPYPHYQQPYGPPPGSHYMNARPPPQHNGSPIHYPEHGAPGQPQQPHDVYGQPSHPALAQQQPAAVPPTPAGVSGNQGLASTAVAVNASDGTKGDSEKKDGVAE